MSVVTFPFFKIKCFSQEEMKQTWNTETIEQQKRKTYQLFFVSKTLVIEKVKSK